jgi:hypothetical protein
VNKGNKKSRGPRYRYRRHPSKHSVRGEDRVRAMLRVLQAAYYPEHPEHHQQAQGQHEHVRDDARAANSRGWTVPE